jgi:lipopolysaccharide export system permease protein
MKILHKHVVKEILIPFVIAFVVITFLLLVGNLLRELADRFMDKGLGLKDMALMILYVLPPLITYTIPIALLFATLIAFIQLSQDCEIIAIKSAGIPMRKVFVPAISIGVITTMILLALRAEVSPWAKRELKRFVVGTVMEKPTLVLNEQTWTRTVNNMRIFVGHIDDRRMLLKDIHIFVSNAKQPRRTMVAKTGKIYVGDDRKKIFLELNEGCIHEYDMKHPDRYSTTTFGRLTIPVSIESIDRYLRSYRSLDDLRNKEMSAGQIAQKLSDPSTGPAERRNLLGHIGERTALAFMPLAFVLIGAPLGIIPHKARRFYGLVVCAGLLLAYYALLALGEALSDKSLLNPLFAMWVPNLFLGATGVAFMIRAERR